MNDDDLLRYSRQILLPEIDIAGQERLLRSKVVVIGLGGLGSPVSMYLAAAGVGHLVLVDPDQVELSNLQRQIIHTTPDIGHLKVESARARLQALNPNCTVETIAEGLDPTWLKQQAADVVIDASDNFDTRSAINLACVQSGTPLVSGAATGFQGQVCVFDRRSDTSPCYSCLYPQLDGAEPTCTQAGVVAPLLGIIGSVQALEALKLVVAIGRGLSGRLLLIDSLEMRWRSVAVPADPQCAVCGAGAARRGTLDV